VLRSYRRPEENDEALWREPPVLAAPEEAAFLAAGLRDCPPED
jgi:hypothetical protein